MLGGLQHLLYRFSFGFHERAAHLLYVIRKCTHTSRLFLPYDPSLSLLLLLYLLWVPLSPSLLLSPSHYIPISIFLSLFHFIVLFLPYFDEFVADFEASNTDTQPYQIPYQNNNNNIIETQFIYVHIVWYILKYVYIHIRRSMCAYARADNNNSIDSAKVIVVHPVRLFFNCFCCCCYFFFSFYPLCSCIYRSHRHTSNIAQALKRHPSGDYHTPSSLMYSTRSTNV